MSRLNRYNSNLQKAAAPRIRRIRKLRESGLTWGEIGTLLGISRQRAQQLGTRAA